VAPVALVVRELAAVVPVALVVRVPAAVVRVPLVEWELPTVVLVAVMAGGIMMPVHPACPIPAGWARTRS
jgi:hypothetical protein